MRAHPVLSLSPQVILKDLEVLAEIASSPAGQTEGHGPSDGSDARPSPVELHVPARASQLSSSGECRSSVPPRSLGSLDTLGHWSDLLRQKEKPVLQ